MLNNLILAEESSEVFVSYGKVITNKDGIIEIVGLEDVVVGEVVNIGNDSVGLIMNIETSDVRVFINSQNIKNIFDFYKHQRLIKNITNTSCESLNTELKAGYTV